MQATLRPKLQAGCLVVFGGIFATVGSCAALTARADEGQGLLTGGFFVLVGLLIAGSGAKTLLAHRAFTTASLECRGPVLLGGTATVDLTLVPRRPLTLGPGCTLTLECVEEATYSAGTRSRTYTEVVHSEPLPPQLPETLAGPLQLTVAVPIPRTAPPTFTGNHNKLFTRVKLHLDIAKWPDLELEGHIEVVPELQR